MLQNLAEDNNNNLNQMGKITTPAIGVVIVVYNRRCDESISFKTVSELHFPAMVLVDNSSEKEFADYNMGFCSSHNIGYSSMAGNKGLPKAYNRGFGLFEHKADYIMLLDDDTEIPEGWLNSLLTAIMQNPSAEILLPYVYDSKGLLSPCRRLNCLFFRLRRKPDTFTSRMSAINSGLVIRTNIRTNTDQLFDESQFLDSVDHLFIFKQTHIGRKFQFYPVEFQQTFFDSLRNGASDQPDRTYARFSGFVKDYLCFCRSCSLNIVLARIYLIFRAIKLNLRYRTVRFFLAL